MSPLWEHHDPLLGPYRLLSKISLLNMKVETCTYGQVICSLLLSSGIPSPPEWSNDYKWFIFCKEMWLNYKILSVANKNNISIFLLALNQDLDIT
jgi:hypothetical protein